VPTSSMVPPSRMEAPSNRSTEGGTSYGEAPRVVHEAATSMHQASLFSTTMMAHPDFSPAAVFKMAAMMCELGNSTVAKALKVDIQAEEAVVDNFQSIFQLVGPKRKVFVPRRVLLDSGAH
jgi:hypothetical protein